MFNEAFNRIIRNEGEYQNDYDDRGNWTSGHVGIGKLNGTRYGISAMSYPDLDIKSLTEEKAKEIYKKDYWDKAGVDLLPIAFRYQMFDACINHGIPNAIKILQRAVLAKDDGIIGPVTLKLAKGFKTRDICFNFLSERLSFMASINLWKYYGKGWANRIALNMKYAAIDLNE